MSDVSEKPFEATPHRIARAKREGNVARSGELAANLAFGAAALSVVTVAPLVGDAVRNAIVIAASGIVPVPASATVIIIALIPVACAASAGALAAALQNGGFAFAPVAFKFERLSPIEGTQRMLSRETLTHAFRAALAFSAAALAMLPVVGWAAAVMIRAGTLVPIATAAWKAAQQVAFAAVTVGLLFAVAEYAAARRAWLRKLRMSFDERKREAKEQEGDSFVRGRRRALHRALAREAAGKVKEASFVVANPTHVAVALAYRPPAIPIPQVLVRAVDRRALHVRALALEYGIPVIENVALARALYAETRTGEPIPQAYYVAVAEIVAALMRAKEPLR